MVVSFQNISIKIKCVRSSFITELTREKLFQWVQRGKTVRLDHFNNTTILFKQNNFSDK